MDNELNVVEAETTEYEGLQFQLINPTEGDFPKRIEWNREQLEAAIRAKTEMYEGLVYTEADVKSAKTDRADLNKLLKQIEDCRKRVKELINTPYAEFEKEIKELEQLIKKPIATIDGQIKDYELRQKEEKKEKIKEAYQEVIGEFAERLPFERFFENQYLNATFKLAKAIDEVKQKIEKVHTDFQTIESMNSKYELQIKDKYFQTLDLSAAMAENKRLAELEAELEERKRKEAESWAARKAAEQARKEEEERKAAEAQQIAEQEVPAEPQSEMGKAIASIEKQAFENCMNPPEQPQEAVEPQKAEESVVNPFATKPEPAPMCKTRFWAAGTMEQLKMLVDFMKENGIKYGKVEQ